MEKVVMRKIVGAAICEKRLECKLTQHDLAALTGLSRNYLSDIENGRYMPSVNALSKIALVLQMNLNFLIEKTEIHDINEGQDET